jgi:hypothetical protein
MKIADLKKLIAELPDEMEVVVSGSDHSYFPVGNSTSVTKAETYPHNRHLSQYYGEDHKSHPNNKVIEVFWIDDGRY